MNIRNLSQYIEHLCGKETLNLLGHKQELLLQKIYGHDPSDDQVKSIIADAASFASNAEEQLFYEFVQNAYDANADSLFFYANKNYLVVLNNGEPFYTDFDIFESEIIREGQLYNFLAKGKSLKRGNSKMLGKYGQGSKLLYTLLTRVDNRVENEELLIDAIYEHKKGPYLISWYNRNQLSNLLQKQPIWTPSQGDDYKNNILFAKILMSYYPVVPGIDEKLFSTKEALDAIDAFDTLVDPRRNLHFLNRGTALIIPLGEGKYERITSEDNLERVRTRLGGFASITRDQDRNEGKAVEHIYVMGEEIEQHKVRSTFIEFDVDGKPFYYHFAFNPIFAKKNFVNLFKGLPILETKLKLGFIIDSQKFDVDSSRQRISDKSKTKVQLVRAFSELVSKLKEMKIENPDKFDYIYKSLIASGVPNGEDYTYIRDSFREVFKPFFEEFVLTTDGSYEKKDNVRCCEFSEQIPLTAIGITKYKWINKEAAKDLHRHGIDVTETDLSSILLDADSTKLQTWIKSLSKKDYASFQELIDTHKTESSVANYKLFRTNHGNLYSFEELQSNANVYYPIEDGIPFGECEHLEHSLTNITLDTFISQLFGKITTNIESLRKNGSTREDVANMLNWIIGKNTSYLSKVRREIKLLSNWHDDYLPFEDLLEDRPQGTILFDNYLVKGKVPDAVKKNEWLLSPIRQKRETWHWVINHWKTLQNCEDWGGVNTHKFINDIKSVYNDLGDEKTSDETKLTLYLDYDGKPTEVLHAIVNNVSRLNENEYNLLDKKVSHLSLLPYEYHAELQEAPFRVETIQSSDIVNESLTADEDLLKVIIKITDRYLDWYRTQETEGKYIVTKTSSGFNYIDNVQADLKEELLKAGFYHIPTIVQSILNTEKEKYRFVSHETMLIKAIERIEHPLKLLPFVKQANANAINSFFYRLKIFEINKKIKKEDFEWQAIELAVQRSTEENNYVEKVFDLIRHNGKVLPSSITQQFIYVGDNQYNIYELDDDYKTDNKTIDSFLNCLPSQNEIDFFKKHFYKDKEDIVSPKDLYNDLYRSALTVEQLRFCIDYSRTNKLEYYGLRINENENVEDALEMILRNKFDGFDKYFKISGVDYRAQIYAPKEILLQNEILPNNVHNWIEANPAILNLFTRLNTIDNPFIRVRKALLDDESYRDVSCFANGSDKGSIDAVFDWAIMKRLVYIYESERYQTMMSIIERLPSDYQVMPFLRYTGEVAPATEDKKNPQPIFSLERCQQNCSFLSVYSWASQFEIRLQKNKKLSRFIKENVVYVYGDKELLFNHNLHNKPRWTIQAEVDLKKFPEYSDSVYDKWKKMPESKGITIHTSDKPIVMNFNIKADNLSIFADKMRDSEYGYEKGKRVIIQYPNKDGLSLMKTIAKHIKSMEFFKVPFISLQSLYVDEWELLQNDIGRSANGDEGSSNLNLNDSALNEEQAQEALNTITKETAENLDKINDITKQMNPDDLDKLNDVLGPIKAIIDVLEKDDLERLAEKKEKIMQMLDDIDEAEEEEKESQVRQTIGFIGELIYSHYLENKKKEFIHAALDGVGEYDFEVISDNMYVDVKTTLYSLKDGTAPFYLHRSQNVFMQQHPNSKYHIVRISLIDLDLQQSYKEIRDTYGKDANPLENPNLKKACEKIARKYWKAAKIDEFDALSPEYAIRIEQK